MQQSSHDSPDTTKAGESVGSDYSSLCYEQAEFSTHADVFGTYQVLSINDDTVNQMLIDSLLGSKGYEVTCALNAQEAMKCLDAVTVPPDCILLDVMMPEVSGIEFCATLRQQYSTT